MIPFANVNAMTSSSGNGTETNPHILTIDYCENDAFAYNVNGGFCYLKVTFTESAEVSLSFAQTGPWFMVKRAGTTAWQKAIHFMQKKVRPWIFSPEVV